VFRLNPTDFEEFVTRHEAKVFRTAAAVLNNRTEAEDVTQDVSVKAYTKIPEFSSFGHEAA
jgi:RNA polymerase sigma-70 factor (ECF subfamily)